jgi:hypothetical protein
MSDDKIQAMTTAQDVIVVISRAQYEALMAAAKALATLSRNGHTGVGYGIVDDALAALRAAGTHTEGK